MAAAEQQQQQPGSKAAGGSRFAVTCGLLSQYMKEQGGNGALRLAPAVAMGLAPVADAAAAAAEEGTEERKAVLELFPQQAGTLKDEQQRCVLQLAFILTCSCPKVFTAEAAPLTLSLPPY